MLQSINRNIFIIMLQVIVDSPISIHSIRLSLAAKVAQEQTLLESGIPTELLPELPFSPVHCSLQMRLLKELR